MKKSFFIFLVIAGCLIFIYSCSGPDETIILRFSDQNSELGWGPVHALQPWAKKVEEAVSNKTKYKLKIKIYPNQTLSRGKDNWKSIQSGIADMGWCFHGYWPGMTPLADVISLPALPFNSAEKGSEALWKLYEKFPGIRKQFDANHILILYTSDPYSLITTKKQVENLEDLNGMKIRMTGGPPTEQMKALGGIPMSIPMPDVYIALKQGVIDGMGAPWEAVHTYRLYEVVEYYTQTPFPAVYFSIAVNKKKWDSLPDDVKAVISNESGIEGSKFWGCSFDIAKDSVFKMAEESGKKINNYSLSEEERNRWLEKGGKPIWDEWVKKMEDQGYKNAREILNTTLKLLKE